MPTDIESVAPVVLILGDAAPLVQRSVDEVIARGLALCGIPAFNHSRYRGGDSVLDAIAAAQTPPLMSDLRLVEVRDIHEASPSELEALIDYVRSPVPSTQLVLVGTGFRAPTKGQSNFGVRLKNAVKKVGQVIEHKASDVNVARYAVGAAQRQGKRLSLSDATMLVEWLGGDVGRIHSEVDKLALYVDERRDITADDVRATCAMLAEADMWALTGAIAANNLDEALGAVHRLLNGGDDPRRLLSMIAWQMREIVKLTEQVAMGLSDSDIRKRGKVRFEVLKAVRRAGDKAPSAAHALSQLARANRAMNEHRAGDVRILEELVIALCA